MVIQGSGVRVPVQSSFLGQFFKFYFLFESNSGIQSPKQLTLAHNLVCNLAYSRKTFHVKQKFMLKGFHKIGPYLDDDSLACFMRNVCLEIHVHLRRSMKLRIVY